MGVLFQLIDTESANYLYDTNSNRLLKLDDFSYLVLQNALQSHSLENPEDFGQLNITPAGLTPALRKAVGKFHILAEPRFRQLGFHLSSSRMKSIIRQHLQHLVLKITETCNFRCDYCVYGGAYEFERVHSSAQMSVPIAFAAVSYFLDHSYESPEVVISFTGGEPLLQFDLMNKITKLARQKANGRKVKYFINTNGYLLGDDQIDFLVQNSFDLRISLDGPPSIHNAHRYTAGMKPTFDRIMANVKRLYERHRDYYLSHVSFSVVIADAQRADEVFGFFANNEFLNIVPKIVSIVNPYRRLSAYEPLSSNYSQLARTLGEGKRSFVKCLIGDSSQPENHMMQFFYLKLLRQIHLREVRELEEVEWPNDACIPCAHRLYCKTNGDFSFCDKEAVGWTIGNVQDGVNIEVLLHIMDDYCRMSENDCTKCWAVRFCTACFADASEGERFSLDTKREHCRNIRRKIFDELELYCHIMEQAPAAMNKLVRDGTKTNAHRPCEGLLC